MPVDNENGRRIDMRSHEKPPVGQSTGCPRVSGAMQACVATKLVRRPPYAVLVRQPKKAGAPMFNIFADLDVL